MWACGCPGTLWRSEDSFFPSMWVPEIEFRSAGLVTNALPAFELSSVLLAPTEFSFVVLVLLITE